MARARRAARARPLIERLMQLMKVLAILMRALAACLRLLPLKPRVAFLSRQSSKLSLDYRLLIDELCGRLGPDQIVVCLSEPETKNILSFAVGTAKQLYYACTSKVVVIDGYIPAVCIPKKDERTTVIQMWHALGAVKKFGYQCLDTPAGRSSESAQVARMHRNYDWVIAGGPGAVPAYAEAFDYPEERVLPLGLPRVDYLLDASPNSERRANMRKAAEAYPFLDEGKRIVLYAPTLRKGEGYDEDWLTEYVREVASAMCANGDFGSAAEAAGDPQDAHNLQDADNPQDAGDPQGSGSAQGAHSPQSAGSSQGVDDLHVSGNPDTLLVVAGHPLNDKFDESLERDYPFVRLAKGVPTIDLLGFADLVVTDYSAVAFEAGLLGKPLRFYTPDIERYRSSPGLNIEPSAIDQTFVDEYFAGVTEGADESKGSTRRIADLVEQELKS